MITIRCFGRGKWSMTWWWKVFSLNFIANLNQRSLKNIKCSIIYWPIHLKYMNENEWSHQNIENCIYMSDVCVCVCERATRVPFYLSDILHSIFGCSSIFGQKNREKQILHFQSIPITFICMRLFLPVFSYFLSISCALDSLFSFFFSHPFGALLLSFFIHLKFLACSAICAVSCWRRQDTLHVLHVRAQSAHYSLWFFFSFRLGLRLKTYYWWAWKTAPIRFSPKPKLNDKTSMQKEKGKSQWI